MSERTPEQAAAIGATGYDVLLEAGAGTGKTGVIVDRYCRLVCEDGVAPDSLLAFTFTERAAAELRERIRAELARRAGAGSEPAADRLAAIGRAWITTIHGFCNRLLAGHPVAAGVDPRFRVLDELEAERAAREAFDGALEAFLARGDTARERTVAAFEIGGLRGLVLAAHAELRSRGTAAPRLPEQPAPDAEAAVRHAAAVAAAAIAELKPENSNRELLERAVSVLEGSTAPGLDALAGLRTDSRAKSMAPYAEAIDTAVARCAEAGEGGEAYRHVAELLELFSARYAEAKERRAGLDFEDLQILAARLLERGEVGESYRRRFRHLLVDEFQDTNRLQLRLIEALRGPRTELFAVGDELQSIYGFRHADLEVFRERRAAVEADPRAEAMALSGNFRSRPEVIGAVNALGGVLLGDSYRPLRVGAVPAERLAGGPGPAVELLLTARDGWEAEEIELEPATDAATPPSYLAEARFVAERLRALADTGVERGEMVVLLRAFTHLDAFEDSLERAGLRPYVVGGRGYWSQQQVADACALLATIANPLDDQALFGALASPACGASPDTLWLLRAASGRGRHIWPALERLTGTNPEAELDDADRLERIPAAERLLLERFAATIGGLRARAPRLPLAGLLEAALSRTGYDLAVLLRPSGEARYANLRKLMRLAAEFESREGRDLRALLDFLATRAEVDVEAQAATGVEGHDGVRIMTVHSAKGLEFGVVAAPQLSRRLLTGSRAPLLTIGREAEVPSVGLQLRRLGAASVNLYLYNKLREEEQLREAEEELRLVHVAATRARERLILSGVVKPEAGGANGPGTPAIERIVAGFELDRERDSTLPVPAPLPRPGLEASFEPSEIAVRVSLPSPQRAAKLRARRREPASTQDLGEGPPPLVERRPPAVPSRPLSYTAIADYEACGYRFQMERVLDLPPGVRTSSRIPAANANAREGVARRGGRDAAAARGAAVHSLLEWSHGKGWSEPPQDLVLRHALAAGLDPSAGGVAEELLAPLRGWLGSELLRERVLAEGAAVRAEVPLLLDVDGTVLRGSIDLLVEREGEPPLVVDYKTDRLVGTSPAERAATYDTQRTIYALAVSEARRATQVEVAYVFLERPEEPHLALLGANEIAAGRERLAATIGRIAAGNFPPAPPERRDWDLCRGCPALGRLCSGPPA
jgi:ATP-dependent helicase/nuclease subunit A